MSAYRLTAVSMGTSIRISTPFPSPNLPKMEPAFIFRGRKFLGCGVTACETANAHQEKEVGPLTTTTEWTNTGRLSFRVLRHSLEFGLK